jgi:purine-binding chemotaxis protein CheW
MSTPGETAELVVFRLDELRYALPLVTVERVIRAVAVTPLPQAPPVVLGVIDVEGRVLPVFNLRRRFRLPEREIGPADQFVIAHTAQKAVVLSIDEAEGVIERPTASIVHAESIMPELDHIKGVVQIEDGLVLIQDLERFLSADETRVLDEALIREAPHGG